MKKCTAADAFKAFHEEIVRVATKANDARIGHFDDESGSVILNGYKCEYFYEDGLRIFFLAPGELAGTDEPDLLFTWETDSWKRSRLAAKQNNSAGEIAALCFNWLRKMSSQATQTGQHLKVVASQNQTVPTNA